MLEDFQEIQTDTIVQNSDGSYTFDGTDIELIRSLKYVEDKKRHTLSDSTVQVSF